MVQSCFEVPSISVAVLELQYTVAFEFTVLIEGALVFILVSCHHALCFYSCDKVTMKIVAVYFFM